MDVTYMDVIYWTLKSPGKSTLQFLDAPVYYQDPFIRGVYFFGITREWYAFWQTIAGNDYKIFLKSH